MFINIRYRLERRSRYRWSHQRADIPGFGWETGWLVDPWDHGREQGTMRPVRTTLCIAAVAAAALVGPAGVAGALVTPTTGQPGAPNVTCFTAANTANAPGNSMTAPGSVFNPSGQAGAVYAGNPGTASLANSNSGVAISQYDVACLQVTSH
jgi:hypothetical protein